MKGDSSLETEIDALMAVAQGYFRHKRRIRQPEQIREPLAFKQLRHECPTHECLEEFVKSYARRCLERSAQDLTENEKIEGAVNFWLDVVWPNLPEIRQHSVYQTYLREKPKPKFQPGDLIHHVMFNYRGVVIEADENYNGSPEWYAKLAEYNLPKSKPWYHLLVDNSDQFTYVSEQHLRPDSSKNPVTHPFLDQFFESFQDGRYIRRVN